MRVLIIESERGWGQKIDEVKEFYTREEAVKFCREYNDKYNPPMDSAPDWYMYARMEDHERGDGMLRSNVKLTGDPQPHRGASSEQSERG